jgi:hypothetical protein
MIDRIDNNQLLPGASSKFPNAKRILSGNDLDVSINGDYSSLIEMAIKSPQTDEEMIEKARESILSGEIDSPQNILKAAENIITYGI